MIYYVSTQIIQEIHLYRKNFPIKVSFYLSDYSHARYWLESLHKYDVALLSGYYGNYFAMKLKVFLNLVILIIFCLFPLSWLHPQENVRARNQHKMALTIFLNADLLVSTNLLIHLCWLWMSTLMIHVRRSISSESGFTYIMPRFLFDTLVMNSVQYSVQE